MIKTKIGISNIGNPGAVDTDVSTRPAEDTVRARAAYSELPDLRLGKVLEIRLRMAQGRFEPTAEELADAILASAANSRLCR